MYVLARQKNMKKVVVVGAGPAGSYAAELLAKAGYAVELFEEHAEIGVPIQCTGIVTQNLFDLFDFDKSFVVNVLNEVKINAPSKSVVVPLQEYVICRRKFDQYVARRAQSAGVKICCHHKFVRIDNGRAVFSVRGKEKFVAYEILVGADGPHSAVAKAAGMDGIKEYYFGMQAVVEGKFKKDQFEVWFNKEIPGFFAWSVPESETLSRVGVGAKKQSKQVFKEFMEGKGWRIVEMQAGPIPIYNRQQIQKDNVFLVGDAAGLVKATTGGGIITSCLSSQILAECIVTGKEYEKEVRSLRKSLQVHSWLRGMLDKFTDEDYDKLVELMDQRRVKNLLYTHPRDFPKKLLLKLLLVEPRLLLFAKKIFYNKRQK